MRWKKEIWSGFDEGVSVRRSWEGRTELVDDTDKIIEVSGGISSVPNYFRHRSLASRHSDAAISGN